MIFAIKIFVICIGLHQAFARPRQARHSMVKRWAYIENGDPQMRTIHTDCKKIVKEYSDGEMPFYEYTAKMKRCMTRQERTNIPSYDGDYFSPSFNLPSATAKRFETPEYQAQQPVTTQYGSYGYENSNQYQNMYGATDQRGNIPQTPQYGVPQTQAQVFPAYNYNYYQQNQPETQMTARSEIPAGSEVPAYQEPYEQNTMYSSDIVKKDEIPRPNEQ